MTGDRWEIIMHESMKVNSYYTVIAPFLFVTVLVIGVWIVRALFLAALLENMDLQNAQSSQADRKEADKATNPNPNPNPNPNWRLIKPWLLSVGNSIWMKV